MRLKKVFEKVLFEGMFENFPNFTRDRNLQNQEAELMSNIRSTTGNLGLSNTQYCSVLHSGCSPTMFLMNLGYNNIYKNYAILL